jgi:hypothetical protein
MGRNVCEPVIQPTDIHGSRRDDVLKMRSRLPDIARTAQSHPAHTLGMDAFYTSPLIIHLRKLFRLSSLPSCFESEMRLTPSNGEGSPPCLRAVGSLVAGATNREAKLDFDDLLVAGSGWRPTATQMSLWTASLLIFLINGEIA